MKTTQLMRLRLNWHLIKRRNFKIKTLLYTMPNLILKVITLLCSLNNTMPKWTNFNKHWTAKTIRTKHFILCQTMERFNKEVTLQMTIMISNTVFKL